MLTYSQELVRYLETPTGLAYLKTNPNVVGPSWPEFVSMAALPGITAAVLEVAPPLHPYLQPLTSEQLPMLQEALSRKVHAHSGYTTASLLGWSDLIRYGWVSLEGALCLFAEQAGGLFMPLPPLGDDVTPKVLQACWEILTQANQGHGVSRIEGIELADAPLFAENGFKLLQGEPEYLYRRKDLITLKGNRYRSQRWAINRCVRQISCRIRSFEEEDLVECLKLYTAWGIERQQSNRESFPKALIRDGLFFHRRLMMDHEKLNLVGRVLEVEGQIRGYTFGAKVSSSTFCIFLEITDRSIQGLAQLLFREFCRELEPYEFVNAMGDEGLPGLRRAKEAYRPVGMIPTFMARQSS